MKNKTLIFKISVAVFVVAIMVLLILGEAGLNGTIWVAITGISGTIAMLTGTFTFHMKKKVLI